MCPPKDGRGRGRGHSEIGLVREFHRNSKVGSTRITKEEKTDMIHRFYRTLFTRSRELFNFDLRIDPFPREELFPFLHLKFREFEKKKARWWLT